MCKLCIYEFLFIADRQAYVVFAFGKKSYTVIYMRKEESGSTNKQNDPHNNMCQTKRKPKKQGATTAKAPLFVSVDLAAERTPCVGDLRLIPVARESNISKYRTM